LGSICPNQWPNFLKGINRAITRRLSQNPKKGLNSRFARIQRLDRSPTDGFGTEVGVRPEFCVHPLASWRPEKRMLRPMHYYADVRYAEVRNREFIF